LDVSKPLTDEDKIIIDKNRTGNIIAAINKIDLPPAWETNIVEHLCPQAVKIMNISAKSGAGLEDLKNTLIDLSGSGVNDNTGGVMITNMRHKLAIEKAYKNIQTAKESIERGMSAEFAAFDLHEALNNLDEITGRKINDEILNKIFSSFCIGK
jgi:tRNA modification GTPase